MVPKEISIMNFSNRNYKIIVSGVLMFLTIVFYFATDTLSHEYKKKVSFSSFTNPEYWNKDYNPSVIVKSLLEKTLSSNNDFEIVKFSEKQKSYRFPYQYLVHGTLLEFKPELNEEGVTINLKIFIEDPITEKILFHKMIPIEMPEGRIGFEVREGQRELDENILNKSGMGRAIKQLVIESSKFIKESLINKPFEANIIEVFPGTLSENGDKKNNQKIKIKLEKSLEIEYKKKLVEFVTINAGSKNGVNFRDRFYVYSIKTQFLDSVTDYNLGTAFKRVGVIRVSKVRENYSTAIVEAGEGFAKAQVIRPYKKRRIGSKLQPPWWAFSFARN